MLSGTRGRWRTCRAEAGRWGRKAREVGRRGQRAHVVVGGVEVVGGDAQHGARRQAEEREVLVEHRVEAPLAHPRPGAAEGSGGGVSDVPCRGDSE